MTNFDFLYGDPRFASFASAAAAAETIFSIDTAACVINARRAAELAVKWMYTNDTALPPVKRDQLAALTGASGFRNAVGHEIVRALDFIRRVGNNAAHNPESITKEQGELVLRHLFTFTSFLAERYNAHRPQNDYDASLLDPDDELVTEAVDSAVIARLIRENRAMKRILNRQSTQVTDPPRAPLSEAETRRLYIETDIAYAGWKLGVNMFREFRVEGLPDGSGVGYADYVLCDNDLVPIALVETQASGTDLAVGRQQAKLYADALEKQFGIRPVIFLSSGFSTHVWFDTTSAERQVSGIFSRTDLLRIRSMHAVQHLPDPADTIGCVDRPYQQKAVEAVLDALCRRKERNVFLAMAPGSGKTITAFAAAEILTRCSWMKNMLFLSGSDILAEQAMRQYRERTKGGQCVRITDHAGCLTGTAVFATYEEVLAEADDILDESGNRLFTAGHFDLLVCDETDAITAEKYRDVLEAFDAPRLLLTSTPSEIMDPALCAVLGTPPCQAAFRYTLQEAAAEGWLADYHAIDVRFRLLENGLNPADYPPDTRDNYYEFFRHEGIPSPRSILPHEWFNKYYNTATVRLVLELLRERGIRHGDSLGKTIIFTENALHSNMIYSLWGKLYPTDPPHFCRVIDSATNYAASLVESFSGPDTLPCVAVSHDLLTDGVDLPYVENLVFFTRAASRTRFWRMLGRAMRRCAALPDGKSTFFVVDLCGNFRTYENGSVEEPAGPQDTAHRLFAYKARLAAVLQRLEYSESCTALRTALIRDMQAGIRQLDRESFAVRQRLQALARFSGENAFSVLNARDVELLCTDVAPLVLPAQMHPSAARFDEQMYQLMLARANHENTAPLTDLIERRIRLLSEKGSVAQIAKRKKLINRILCNAYLDNADLPDLENARQELHPLFRFIEEEESRTAVTNFADEILDITTVNSPRIKSST